jgi:hypothetical protein
MFLIISIISTYTGYEITRKQKLFISEQGILLERKNKTEFSCNWDQIITIRTYKTIPGLAAYGYVYHIRINLKDNDYFDLNNDFGWTKKKMKRILQEIVIYQNKYDFIMVDELHWVKE